jgi:prevent-host-death family protein
MCRGSCYRPIVLAATKMCHVCATIVHIAMNVSVRDLRNSTADVVAAVRAGELVTLTVNRDPVADIVPHSEQRDPWVASAVLRDIVREAPADEGLLTDLADVRGALVEDV